MMFLLYMWYQLWKCFLIIFSLLNLLSVMKHRHQPRIYNRLCSGFSLLVITKHYTYFWYVPPILSVMSYLISLIFFCFENFKLGFASWSTPMTSTKNMSPWCFTNTSLHICMRSCIHQYCCPSIQRLPSFSEFKQQVCFGYCPLHRFFSERWGLPMWKLLIHWPSLSALVSVYGIEWLSHL